ncbi:MAG: hypothetical protein IJB78_06650 [Oscillospiraceae bacterium]|nr:hypothetical protein [Oscillospiraceae bacterium]
MNRYKYFLSLLLCLCILCSMSSAAWGENRLSIATADEFLNFARNCVLDSYSWELDVRLTADIDLFGKAFEGIPIFCGRFDGQGHTISGVNIQGKGSVQGLFRYLTETATVKNLKLEGRIIPTGSRSTVGALVGENSGRLINCSFDGAVRGADMVGGIAGENTVTGIIEKCSVSGEISGSHFVGGLAGNNLGVIRESSNSASITTTPEENTVTLSQVTIDSITGTENINTSTDVGGIAGASQGFIRDCVNHGSIGYKQMGYNVGGITGSQMGYITSSHNYGDISGRKEVGGIAGQMEPSAHISFEKDTLQILTEQLDALSSTVSAAGSNLQSTSNALGGYTSVLMSQIGDTGQALHTLGQDSGGNFDQDTMYAAENVLSSGISSMSVTVQGMANAATGSMNALSGNIQALGGQINAMRSTLGNISNTVGGTFKDVSDRDTPDNLTGKLENCTNAGLVSGDRNVGGITGAIAVENDFDANEDFTIGDNESANFVSELRAVILSCRNSGKVRVNHDSAGGIVGHMQFGLVKDSSSTAAVDGEGAKYLGGVAGRSEGYLRRSSAKGELRGDSYVGGIAGQGNIVTDCRSMVKISGNEKLGSVLGYGELEYTDDGSPNIFNNYYFGDAEDKGGIDGVSYASVAQPLGQEVFMGLEYLSDIFRKVNLSFIQEDGTVDTVTIDSGSRIDEKLIPAPHEKKGHLASWADFKDVVYDYDASFHAEYTAISSTVESLEKSPAGLPLLLAEGSFMPGSTLHAYQAKGQPLLEENERLIVALRFESSDVGIAHTLRFHVGEEPERMRAFVGIDGQQWQQAEYKLVGSYAVVELPNGMDSLAFAAVGAGRIEYAAVAGAVALSCLIVLLIMRHSAKRRKKALAEAR